MDSRRKKQKDAGKPVKVELPHTNQTERSHILHEQEYNTGHDLQAMADFKKQLSVHNRRTNNLPVRPLDWRSPCRVPCPICLTILQ